LLDVWSYQDHPGCISDLRFCGYGESVPEKADLIVVSVEILVPHQSILYNPIEIMW